MTVTPQVRMFVVSDVASYHKASVKSDLSDLDCETNGEELEQRTRTRTLYQKVVQFIVPPLSWLIYILVAAAGGTT